MSDNDFKYTTLFVLFMIACNTDDIIYFRVVWALISLYFLVKALKSK